jgi:arylsulfatase
LEGRLDRTIPIQFSLGKGLDIGRDVGSPIDFTNELPFEFTGKIDKVTIELKPERSSSVKPKASDKAVAAA